MLNLRLSNKYVGTLIRMGIICARRKRLSSKTSLLPSTLNMWMEEKRKKLFWSFSSRWSSLWPPSPQWSRTWLVRSRIHMVYSRIFCKFCLKVNHSWYAIPWSSWLSSSRSTRSTRFWRTWARSLRSCSIRS